MIVGIFDYLQRWHPGSSMLGFLGGPRGLMQNQYKTLTAEELVRRGAGCGGVGARAWSLSCPMQCFLTSSPRPAGPRCVPRPACLQDGYRNQGGFHLIGSGRDKIEKPDQLASAAEVGGGVYWVGGGWVGLWFAGVEMRAMALLLLPSLSPLPTLFPRDTCLPARRPAACTAWTAWP